MVFFKLMLVSDRRLVAHGSLRLDIRYFLGYEVAEDLPWHSTSSRTCQLFPAAVFEHLFGHVFAPCVAVGLVTGHAQAVNAAFVKANASLERLCEKPPTEAPAPVLQVARELVVAALVAPPAALRASPAHHLQRVAAAHARHNSGPLGRDRPLARLLRNKTHDSPADPDARLSVKPGKARALNYLCRLAVDEGHGLIRHVPAGFADRRDRTRLPGITAPLHQRLIAHALLVRAVVADPNYANGLNYALLKARGITPWIPVFGRYKPEIEGFTYAQETDCFACPAGKSLPFKRFDPDQDGRLAKRYRAATGDCRRCPRKPTCIPKRKRRKITRPAYNAHDRRARQQSRPGRRMRRLRQRPVEPVFGSLLPHYGLRRVNTRGRSSAHKTMLLTAISFNLKKLLKHQPKQTQCLAIALPIPLPAGQFSRFWRRRCHRHNRLDDGKRGRDRSSATATAPF